MMNPLRYAVYLAPPPESALWRFGSAVVGRDAASGEAQLGFAPDGFDATAWRSMTTEPRRYGFHATIKAPFRLAEDASLSDLSTALAELAHAQTPFSAGRLAVSTLALGEGAAFVALTSPTPSPKIAEIEERVVRGLDAFRAPLNEAERARRDPAAAHPAPARNFRALGIPLRARRVPPPFHPDQRHRRGRADRRNARARIRRARRRPDAGRRRARLVCAEA